MNFLIADTFTDSLARLSGDEQKSVKTTAFDLQLNPANPGQNFHKLDRARDPNFWSIRISSDIRLIVHKTDSSLLLCYVDHHDNAYRWAQKRKLETHPRTGAAQFVEVRETVVDVEVPHFVPAEIKTPPAAVSAPKVALFAGYSDEKLLGFGVPAEWIEEVRKVNEDTLLNLAEHLPAEASEALLELAVGGTPKPQVLLPTGDDPFQHPDAMRRFRTVTNVEELAVALDYPWEKWAVFLHPAQREMVERDYNGPARAAGSAGTGKTVVALHRAVYLARNNPDSRVLLTTFSPALANQLRTRLRLLIASEPRLAERLEVTDINEVAERLYGIGRRNLSITNEDDLRMMLQKAASEVDGHKFSIRFLISEWTEVVDAWHLNSWDEYRDVRRLGRKTRLPEPQRALLWSIFLRGRAVLLEKQLVTHAAIFTHLAFEMKERKNLPFDFVVVDEAQDVSIPQLRFLAAIGGDRPNALFFAGDLGQRIFQSPFSWLSLGVDVRGRSRSLKINYRTSHQIRARSDRLLGSVVTDVDGNEENRKGTVSVFNGPDPAIHLADSEEDEARFVADWIKELGGIVQPHEICLIVRSEAQLDRARLAAISSEQRFLILEGKVEPSIGKLSICTMHLAKGLEFRAVAIIACDDEVVPLQSRIETVTDDNDLDEVYNTERHLLYVACTRARDYLLITSSGCPSEFLVDLEL